MDAILKKKNTWKKNLLSTNVKEPCIGQKHAKIQGKVGEWVGTIKNGKVWEKKKEEMKGERERECEGAREQETDKKLEGLGEEKDEC